MPGSEIGGKGATSAEGEYGFPEEIPRGVTGFDPLARGVVGHPTGDVLRGSDTHEDGIGRGAGSANTPRAEGAFDQVSAPELTEGGGDEETPAGDTDRPPQSPSGSERPPWLPSPGTQFRSCQSCPEMIVVPGGSFKMGSSPNEIGRYEEEALRTVYVDAFAIGVYEVTAGEFAQFIEETGRSHVAPDFPQDQTHPAVNVSWDDADAYVQWLADRTGLPYRLPTESEWEYAARAGSGAARWWGGRVADVCGRANVGRAPHGCVDRKIGTMSVGSYEANSFGVYDVIGNAWEWTQECWVPDGRADEFEHPVLDPTEGCALRVKKGGGWNSGPRTTRAATKGRDPPDRRINTNGFRVALGRR